MRSTKVLTALILFSATACKLFEFAQPAFAADPSILLSEVYPDPESGQKEYVELFNPGAEEVSLDGFTLHDVSSPQPGLCVNEGKLMTLSGPIGPKEYRVFELSSARLNNAGDLVKIKDPAGRILDQLSYGVCGEVESVEGYTIGRTSPPAGGDQNFQRLSPTPSGPNYLLELDPITPSGVFELNEIVSFETSADVPEQNINSLVWKMNESKIGEGVWIVDYIIEETDQYAVSAGIVDTYGNSDSQEFEFEISEDDPEDYSGLVINEVFPSPSPGAEEWVELYNGSSEEIDLSGVILDDMLGGGSPAYTLPDGAEIGGKGYLVIPKSESGIALNNSGDWVVLLEPESELAIDEIEYPAVDKDEAYALYEGDWYLTSEPTPGEENVLPEEALLPAEVISIAEAKEKLEAEVLIEGSVTSADGEVGAGIVYVQDKTGGIRVKTDSELERGQVVQIKGEIREAWGEIYIKAEEAIDQNKTNTVSPRSLSLSKVDESYLSELIEVKGEVSKVQSGSIWIVDENGENELKIYISSSLDWERPDWIEKGVQLKAVGVMSQWGFSDEGEPNLRVLPRNDKDLTALGDVKSAGSALGDILPKTFAGWPVLPGFAGLFSALGAKLHLRKKRKELGR